MHNGISTIEILFQSKHPKNLGSRTWDKCMIHMKMLNKHRPRDKSTGGLLRNGENCFDAGNDG